MRNLRTQDCIAHRDCLVINTKSIPLSVCQVNEFVTVILSASKVELTRVREEARLKDGIF